jgi:hypothetical protein
LIDARTIIHYSIITECVTIFARHRGKLEDI